MGYIGSFTTLALLLSGYRVIIVDNLANSSPVVLSRLELLTGQRPIFHECDVTDLPSLSAVFAQYPQGTINSVIHFAALKSVGESAEVPLEYYRVNVGGTITLLQAMQTAGVKTLVFSSSATVYGDATRFESMIPIPEECPLGPTNSYGRTKMMIEMVITDHVRAHKGWRAGLLRYFNPAGAHPSGIMGEDPQGVPYNLLPLLGQVAVGRSEKLHVYGTDYSSHDGTAIRDYIHVMDLAEGHLFALRHLRSEEFPGPARGSPAYLEANKQPVVKPPGKNPGLELDIPPIMESTEDNVSGGVCRAYNLGTGKGSTVFDIHRAFSDAVGKELPYELHPRREGDVLDLTAKVDRVWWEVGWKAERTVAQACADLWVW